MEFTEEDIRQSIPARFERVADRCADRLAIKAGERQLTYAQLNRYANRVARAIRSALGPANEPVALLFDDRIDAVAAIVAALKAGKFFAALDRSAPPERNKHILDDLQPRAILTDAGSLTVVPEQADREPVLINIDAIDESYVCGEIESFILSENLALIQYTSGSTGDPKGVVRTHENILHTVRLHTRRARISAEDRLSLLHPLSAAAAYGHLFSALLSGASLFPFDVRSSEVHRFTEWLREEKVTVYHSTPAVFRQLADAVSKQDKLAGLRLIHLGGAPITRRDFDVYKQITQPGALLEIGMGSAEAGGVCSAQVGHNFSFPTEGSPIGYPNRGKTVLLLGDDGREVKSGEVGEIAVKSRYLKTGYWRNPELTGARFLTDPGGGEERIYRTGDLGRMLPDGFFVYLGRKDLMVKVRGFTVQITEVENALLKHPKVKEAAVAAWEREPGEKELTAYVVARDSARPGVEELLQFLRETLADYMLPSTWTFRKSLPWMNGKINRSALPKPDYRRPDLTQPYLPPGTDVERRLVQIWESVLPVRPIGVRDNFIELGGHSLAAARIASRIIEQFQLDVPLGSLFRAPTVLEMAAVILEYTGRELGAEKADRILAELEALSDDAAQALLAGGGGLPGTRNNHE